MHKLLYASHLNPTPSNSIVLVQTSVPDVYLPGMLGYMLVSKTNLYVFYFCTVVLKQQKHFLSEYN